MKWVRIRLPRAALRVKFLRPVPIEDGDGPGCFGYAAFGGGERPES
jgi:hypothetical protein